MKKKTTISTAVIVLITSSLFAICFLTYAFYKYSNKNVVVSKIKSNDYLSIDSIKKMSVEDTVKYFQKEILQLKKDNTTNDITNSQLLIDKSSYEKIIDSLERKVYYYREKSRWVKSTIDSVQ